MTEIPPTQAPIFPFSYERKSEIVQNFIEAYEGGQISLVMPQPEDLAESREMFRATAKLRNFNVDTDRFSNEEWVAFYRKILDENAHILRGTKEASDEQVRNAVNFMMDMIWSFRGSNRINGEFLAIPNLKAQVQALQEEVRRHRGALEEISLLVRVLGGNQPH